MRYLLDANIISDLVRNPSGQVADNIRRVGEQNIFTSIIVTAELRFGVAKKVLLPHTEQLRIVLGGIETVAFDEPTDATYGSLRAELEKKGTPIGANAMFIAAHALALGYTLVTDDEREFSQVPGLRVENWLRRT